MISQQVPPKLLARLEKIEQGYVEQFSLCSAVENTLLLGNPKQIDLLKTCRSRHRYLLCEKYPNSRPSSAQICTGHFTDLPYAKESIDLIVLPHILEFSLEPALILSEASECLSNNGTLLVFSLLPFTRFQANNTSSHFPPLPLYKTKQLIADTGMNIIAAQSFFSVLACVTDKKIAQIIDKITAPHLPFLCNAYFIAAQKTVYSGTLTPLKSYTPQKLALAMENSCASQQENI